MPVLERKEIAPKDLIGLFDGSVTAIRIPSYYPEETADLISRALLHSDMHGKYENAPNIGRVGQAFFESQASEVAARRYERDAVKWIRDLRAGMFPVLTPVDRMRLELDEVWPAGAHVAVMGGRKMFVGLARTFGEGSDAEPHQDVFWWDAPESAEAHSVQSQVAMNVYLTMPASGGELTLWAVSYDRQEYNRLRIEQSYGLKRAQLPTPIVTIRPRVGELILFNATKVHAVEEIKKGTRVTWSCFVGYQGDKSPLVLWS